LSAHQNENNKDQKNNEHLEKSKNKEEIYDFLSDEDKDEDENEGIRVYSSKPSEMEDFKIVTDPLSDSDANSNNTSTRDYFSDYF